ncbi:MAG: hypothetical protein R3E64_14965 [Halioglobus sp.]
MRKTDRRFYRTLLLGLAALAAMVWTAVEQFGIPRRDMAELFLATVWIVGGIIGSAALFALLWVAIRKLLHRSDLD